MFISLVILAVSCHVMLVDVHLQVELIKLFLSELILSLSDNNKEKQEESANDKTVELSKNAQFRAIRPSPSILSFVEDNVITLSRICMFDCQYC